MNTKARNHLAPAGALGGNMPEAMVVVVWWQASCAFLADLKL
jgi:hypothetical protein